jgi:hypothetical protein
VAGGYELRLLNASDQPQSATVEILPRPDQVQRLSLNGEIRETPGTEDGVTRLSLRSWEIVTLRVRR